MNLRDQTDHAFVLLTGDTDAHGRSQSLAGHTPIATFSVSDHEILRSVDHHTTVLHGDALAHFDQFLSDMQLWQKNPQHPKRLAVGYIGYEFSKHCVQTPKNAKPIALARRAADDDLPDLWFGVYDDVVRTAAPLRTATAPTSAKSAFENLHCNFTKDSYTAAVRRLLAYIRSGDIYQANLAQRFEIAMPPATAAFELFKYLAPLYPASMSAFLTLAPQRAVLSFSPERFVQVQHGMIASEPIKGTTPRHMDPERDAAQAQALLASPKNRAELTMIVDLMRNDLGRLCETGSIRVPDLARLQALASVHHLIGRVTGRLHKDTTPGQILAATFPGGSITGAPKVRAMEIIAELEGSRRNVYTGAIGYIGPDQSLDFNIAIRTLTVKGASATVHAGAGIVADSDPVEEYEETLAKIAPLLAGLNAWRTIPFQEECRA